MRKAWGLKNASFQIPPHSPATLSASDQDRVDELSSKASAGSRSEAASQELYHYLDVGFLLGTLQANSHFVLETEHQAALKFKQMQPQRAGKVSELNLRQ